MELISIGKFAKQVGVSVATLRNMEKIGELTPYHVSKGYQFEMITDIGSGIDYNKKV